MEECRSDCVQIESGYAMGNDVWGTEHMLLCVRSAEGQLTRSIMSTPCCATKCTMCTGLGSGVATSTKRRDGGEKGGFATSQHLNMIEIKYD